jgi:hypothetical protein
MWILDNLFSTYDLAALAVAIVLTAVVLGFDLMRRRGK